MFCHRPSREHILYNFVIVLEAPHRQAFVWSSWIFVALSAGRPFVVTGMIGLYYAARLLFCIDGRIHQRSSKLRSDWTAILLADVLSMCVIDMTSVNRIALQFDRSSALRWWIYDPQYKTVGYVPHMKSESTTRPTENLTSSTVVAVALQKGLPANVCM